eukprot:g2735.t1
MSTSMLRGQDREEAAMTTFAATTAVNVPCSVAQDRFYTRWFGTQRPKPLPIGSYASFAARDAMTVLASFSLPHIIADYCANGDDKVRDSVFVKAQVICPVAMQLLSTPLHVVGLHLYNTPGASLTERLAEISRSYSKTAFMRICRILPAFGLAGVLNNSLRDWGEERFVPVGLRHDELARAAEEEDSGQYTEEENCLDGSIVCGFNVNATSGRCDH